jgi:hypothetical protein
MKTINKVLLGVAGAVVLSVATADTAQAGGFGRRGAPDRHHGHWGRLSCGPQFSVGWRVYVPAPVYYVRPPPVYWAPPPPPRVYYYSRSRCGNY